MVCVSSCCHFGCAQHSTVCWWHKVNVQLTACLMRDRWWTGKALPLVVKQYQFKYPIETAPKITSIMKISCFFRRADIFIAFLVSFMFCFFFFHFVRHFFFVPSFLMKFPLVIQAVAHFGLLLLSHFLFLLIFIDLNSSKLTYHLNPTACECPLKCPINYLF